MSSVQYQAIVFADVSGSTKLFELRGDVRARQLISAVLDALREVVDSHHGQVVKTIGDELMCAFSDMKDALPATIAMQKRIASDLAFASESMAIRIGLHAGEVLIEPNDVYGDAVNVAARMVALAKREQIVATAASIAEVPDVAARARALGTARVSGKQWPIEISEILWQENLANLTMVQRAVNAPAAKGEAVDVKLTLRYRGAAFEITPASPPFTLGREANSSLVVDSEWVSRNHATIEYKRGYFVLSDRSTNGTWVKLGNEDELRMHRDEIHLRKSGAVSLGQTLKANSQDILYFQCVYAAAGD